MAKQYSLTDLKNMLTDGVLGRDQDKTQLFESNYNLQSLWSYPPDHFHHNNELDYYVDSDILNERNRGSHLNPEERSLTQNRFTNRT